METKKRINVNGINAINAVDTCRQYIKTHDLPSDDQQIIENLCNVAQGLVDRLTLNSRNSSKPPSTDRDSNQQNTKHSNRKPGGQKGHKGCSLPHYDHPDECIYLPIEQSDLPAGEYREGEIIRRQVIDIKSSRHVIEYQAQVLIDQAGKKWIAQFPQGVNAPTQYSYNVKAYTVYHAVEQLMPYKRLCQQLSHLFNIKIGQATLASHILQGQQALKGFQMLTQLILIFSKILHADETSIHVHKKKQWIHTLSNNRFYLLHLHKKRGFDATESMGILPYFKGTLIHDHWKPYYMLKQCKHSLCNAHHLRELTRAHEQDQQKWADKMYVLLQQTNQQTKDNDGCLPEEAQKKVREQYRLILQDANIECPEKLPKNTKRKRRPAQSKARNLLERLRDYEDDTLRFMTDPLVSFTNNEAERSIRMSKVKEKISGTFRSEEFAHAYCLIRSYLLTCQAHQVDAHYALTLLMQNQYPEFIQSKLDYYGGIEQLTLYLHALQIQGVDALSKIPIPPPE